MDLLNSIILLTNFIVVPAITYGSQLALGAIGVTLIYGVLRFANFAYGDLMAFATMIVILFTWYLQSFCSILHLLCAFDTSLLRRQRDGRHPARFPLCPFFGKCAFFNFLSCHPRLFSDHLFACIASASVGAVVLSLQCFLMLMLIPDFVAS